jgi:nitroreductase
MQKIAETQVPIHELIGRRWSPRAFSDRPVEADKLLSLFEAARWAASASNEQPWAFLVATRQDSKNYE